MEQSEIAIVISVCSALIATFSLGWNVYRDVILKPRVIVTIAKKNIISESAPPSPDYVGIHAVNHGPGPVIINTIVLKNSSLWKKLRRKEDHAVMMRDWTNLYSSKLPVKIEVGESLNLFSPYDENCFLKERYTHIGLRDSFGRSNWANITQFMELRAKWIVEFSGRA